MNRLPDELEAKINAEVEALVRDRVGSYYEPEIVRKRQELEALESEYSQAIKRYVERILGEDPHSVPSQTSKPERKPDNGSQESHTARNGSSGTLTRKKMMLAVLSDFGGNEFIRRDVEAKIIERWPEAKPQTDTEHNNFTSGLASALSNLVKKGQIERTKGKTPFDPTVYRVINNDEDTLLRSGP